MMATVTRAPLNEPHYIDPHGPEAKAMAAKVWERYVRDVADPEDVKRYGMDEGLADPLTGMPVDFDHIDHMAKPTRDWLARHPEVVRPPNPSGIVPNEYKVLILPDAVEEKTKGGIIIPVSKKETDEFAMTTGTLIACSPLAFTYASEAEWKDAFARKPQAGDRIIYERYVGVRVKGPKDGVEYVLCNDRSIFATVEK